MRKAVFAILFFPLIVLAQPPQQPNAAQLKLKLRKLNFLGSVLYMAAHPDDENTRIITWLANGRLATTAYLSLTRGDGGQNLVGPEIRDLLGVIRTQELLAARRIDGGQQFFTRAIDFGYSKSAGETFRLWDKETVLGDVLKIFRQYQPDIIITRFPPDERAGHGQHTASAVLAHEAFDLAAKADVHPDQVKDLGTWQPKRLLTNTGRWWNREISEKTPGIISVDVGGYNPLLGRSYPEIAALSGSQHKSQGWGQPGNRGYLAEFLEPAKGDKPATDIFDGINTTWSRVKGGEKVQALVDRAIAQFEEDNPSASVPLLFQIRREIASLDRSVWRDRKLAETEGLIVDCLGLYVSATAGYYYGSPGEKTRSSLEIVNRGGADISIARISAPAMRWDTVFANTPAANVKVQIITASSLPAEAKYSEPYWLRSSHEIGLFKIEDPALVGKPQNDPAVEFVFTFHIQGETVEVKRPLLYRWTDPVKGELWRPFEIVPPVFINSSEKAMVFSTTEPKDLRLLLKSTIQSKQSGTLRLDVPDGWKTEPSNAAFELTGAGDEVIRTFRIVPPQGESRGTIRAVAEINGRSYDESLVTIDYDHIPVQTLLPAAETNVVRIDLKKEGNTVAYIRGAGDETPAALRNMGYEVWEMKNEEVTPENLKKVDAVVLGVRAVNTNPRIRYFMADLLNYVKEGGTLVMQYNTNSDYEVQKFSPFDLKISRDRVTEEDAEIRILKPSHPVLNVPNKITSRDFDDWVQERGLYFPNQWDPAFETIFSTNDQGEPPKEGSLLVARYGNGYYIYTGLSFFRQLPEGVSGAYRLFANLISIGKPSKAETSRTRTKKQTR